MRAYEDKLLRKVDEGFWRERSAAWQAELAGINGELQSIQNAPSKADLLAAARKPVELLQAVLSLYVTPPRRAAPENDGVELHDHRRKCFIHYEIAI